MNNYINAFGGGIRVYEDANMPIFTTRQNKAINLKRWMKGKCYHKRINKKLLKKFGSTTERLFLFHGNNIFTNPANARMLNERL